MKYFLCLILFVFISFSPVFAADGEIGNSSMGNVGLFTQKRYCEYIEYIDYSEYYANKDLPGKPSLILVAHSGREKGNVYKQLNAASVTSLLKYVEKYKIKTVIIVPSFPALYGVYSKESVDMVAELVRQKALEYRVPKNKVYATGASFGGSAVHSIMTEHPKLFKKILFVSYSSAKSIKTSNLRGRQIYYIVGTEDTSIHLNNTLNALKEKNDWSVIIEYKFLKGKNHIETMEVAYTEDVWDWLFRNTLKRLIFENDKY